jgi:hypothetical protein
MRGDNALSRGLISSRPDKEALCQRRRKLATQWRDDQDFRVLAPFRFPGEATHFSMRGDVMLAPFVIGHRLVRDQSLAQQRSCCRVLCEGSRQVQS